MTARANQRNVRSIMKKVNSGDKLNILTFPTHERYEQNLCRTGHNFYAFDYGKKWNSNYAPVPSNYHIIDHIPESLDIDLVLHHTSCDRLVVAHDLLSQTSDKTFNKLAVPTLRHCHILPNQNADTLENQQEYYKSMFVNKNSFISNYNAGMWGYRPDECEIIEHGIDTIFFDSMIEFEPEGQRDSLCLSVVNDWINRDWCCGFGLWASVVGLNTTHELPIAVIGDTPGLSLPAKDVAHLKDFYCASAVFLNTSLVSPVPTALMEAMACGCAVVSTNNCMIPEIVEHGVNGFLSNDPNELRSYVQLLLKDKSLAKQLGIAARRTIVERFSLDQFVNKWNDLFYKTIGEYNEGLLGR